MSKNQDPNLVPRITGLLILEVRKSNPNGDPERESSPRQRPDGKGEISPVSVKRKLRDLVLEKEGVVWQEVKKTLEIPNDDGFQILESRGRDRVSIETEIMENRFVAKYWDARLFGNTFLEDADKLKDRHKKASDEELAKVKNNIRAGVCHFGVGVSIAPIEIEFSTWTNKSGVETGKDRGMAPMAFRVVKHSVYAVPFFVNPNLAHKTGCTKLDVDLMLHLLKHTYAGNRSVVRSMVEVIHAHTFTHNSRAGSVSDFVFLDALMPKKNGNPDKPSESLADYGDLPTWEKIKDLPVRSGSKVTFAQCGEYKDYAL
jgi:Cas7 group CRISPR-associated protein Csh2